MKCQKKNLESNRNSSFPPLTDDYTSKEKCVYEKMKDECWHTHTKVEDDEIKLPP